MSTSLVRLAACVILGAPIPLFADLIVDHQPHPYGGPGSDTLYRTSLGQTFWQRAADDFTLNQPETIASLRAWGFYDLDNPPPAETMRIRFYAARPSDGLPDDGNIIYEQSFSNLPRTDTGRHILDNSQREFVYQADLAIPPTLGAGETYWFEFAQIGDASTAFKWEFSNADSTGHAFVNPVTGGTWQHTVSSFNVDAAFQLSSVPEPDTLSILFCTVLVVSGFKIGGERRRPCMHAALRILEARTTALRSVP